MPITEFQQRKTGWQASVSACREARMESSVRYRRLLWDLLAGYIPAGMSVLHVGCGTGDLLAMLQPRSATGIEPGPSLVAQARERHPSFKIHSAPFEDFSVQGDFDYILVTDALIDCFDVDDLLECLHRAGNRETRFILCTYSQLWRPLLKALRFLRLAKPRFGDTWLSPEDIRAALQRRGFELITASPGILLPTHLPVLGTLANRFFARLPFFQKLCLHQIFVARKAGEAASRIPSVSVVVPARNEAGNIPRLMREIPAMGAWTETIFVEGNSTDDTWEVLQREVARKNDPRTRLIRQPGKGKGDAVRAGFAEARGDILMILDADLTVPAEALPRFYEVIASGFADFANGTRLVYRMDDKAMQFLNLLANHFFAHAFTWVLGQPVRDTLCGTKVLRRELYAKIAANRAYFGDFDPFGDFDLLFGAARLNAKITDVPVRYRERVYGTTNISRFRHGVLLLQMLLIATCKLKFRK